MSYKLHGMVGLVVECKGGNKSGLSSHIATYTYIPSCLSIVWIFPLPRVSRCRVET